MVSHGAPKRLHGLALKDSTTGTDPRKETEDPRDKQLFPAKRKATPGSFSLPGQ